MSPHLFTFSSSTSHLHRDWTTLFGLALKSGYLFWLLVKALLPKAQSFWMPPHSSKITFHSFFFLHLLSALHSVKKVQLTALEMEVLCLDIVDAIYVSPLHPLETRLHLGTSAKRSKLTLPDHKLALLLSQYIKVAVLKKRQIWASLVYPLWIRSQNHRIISVREDF